MSKNLRIPLAILTAALLVAAAIYTARRDPFVVENSGYRMIMGTVAQVTVVADSTAAARRCIDQAFRAMDLVNESMNDRDPESELSHLNDTAFEQEVRVSPELFSVLYAAQQYSQISGGAFDATVGPEVALWRAMEKSGTPPTPQQIEQARAKVGYEKLILNPQEQTVQFEREGMRLDLGGIAKGYAIDQAIDAIKQNGGAGGMVDIGGDIRCFGAAPGRSHGWIIGLQDPRQEGNLIAQLRMHDEAVATSGDYRRFVEVEGKRESHILNPATSQSADALISVTVLAPTAMEADALATAVSVMGRERGMKMIESLAETEGFLIAADHPAVLIKTSGAAHYLVQ